MMTSLVIIRCVLAGITVRDIAVIYADVGVLWLTKQRALISRLFTVF